MWRFGRLRAAAVLVVAVATPAAARAQSASDCPDGQICSSTYRGPIPPGPAPTGPTPFEEQARAKGRADAEGMRGDIWQKAHIQVDAERGQRFHDRAEAARPPDVDVRTPLIETTLAMRVGFASSDLAYAGPTLTAGMRFAEGIAFELPVSLLQMHSPFGRWATLGTRPAFVFWTGSGATVLFLRVAPDVLLPLSAPEAPKAFAGAALGGGLTFVATPLGDYGYVGITLDLNVALRASIESRPGTADDVTVGWDGAAGVRFAL